MPRTEPHPTPRTVVASVSPDAAADATTITKDATRPAPPEPSEVFPVWPPHAKRLEEFRRERPDSEWAGTTQSVIEMQLVGVSKYTRVRLLECRCSGCMFGFLIWHDRMGASESDVPRVHWAGLEQHGSSDADILGGRYAKYWDGGAGVGRRVRDDGWAEQLHFFARHPRDAQSEFSRVHSHASPLNDPACARGQSAKPRDYWAVPNTGWGGNALWFRDRRFPHDACSCACGKTNLATPLGQCNRRLGTSQVACTRLPNGTPHGVARIEGLWSCERAPD